MIYRLVSLPSRATGAARYQLAKSVGRSMAIYEVVSPYLAGRAESVVRAPLQMYRTKNQSALDGLSDWTSPTKTTRSCAPSCNQSTFMDGA